MIDFTYQSIPDYTMAALMRYINQRIRTGGFLEAVLSNDLKEAVSRADHNNINEAPRNCWGSPELVEEWLKSRSSGQP